MKKIQFDTINGVYEVKEFDGVDIMIPDFTILLNLKGAVSGIVYGCEITSDDVFAMVKQEYGIKEIQE